jgi:hypothetical protein
MDLTFMISDEEFELLYSFLAGYCASGDRQNWDRQLAKKLFDQATPSAKKLLGFEYPKFMQQTTELQQAVEGLDVSFQEKLKGIAGTKMSTN